MFILSDHRFETIDKVTSDRQSCLVRGSDGILHLSSSHAYYYTTTTGANTDPHL